MASATVRPEQEASPQGNPERLPDGTLACWQAHERAGLVSCQQPTHRYKRGGHEHVLSLKATANSDHWGALHCGIYCSAGHADGDGAEESDFHTLYMVFDLCEMSTTRSAR